MIPFEPYKLAKVGDRITFRIVSPIAFECGIFVGNISAHLSDNEFQVRRDNGTTHVVKQLSPDQFEGGSGLEAHHA